MAKYFTTHCGIGDMIICRCMFEKFTSSTEEIYISPSTSIAYAFNPTFAKEQIEFSKKFLETIFDTKPFIVTLDPYPDTHTTNLLGGSFPTKYLNLQKQLCDSLYKLDEDNYIVLHCKARFGTQGMSKDFFNIVDSILNHLNKSYNGKIVIIGERYIEPSEESKHCKIISLYDRYISKIDKSKVIDMTIEKLGITPPSLDNLKKDCAIMSKGLCNVVFGQGGNLTIAASVGNLVAYLPVNFCTEYEGLTSAFFKSSGNVFRGNNANDIIAKLNSYIQGR